MKNLLLSLLCASVACTSYANTDKNQQEQKRVEEKVSALSNAMIKGDRDALLALSAPQLSYGHSSGALEDQTAFVEKIASGKSDFVTIDLREQTVTISGDTAVVRHTLNADIKDGGVPNIIELGILLIWQKQAGEWKLLARQAFKLPPKN